MRANLGTADSERKPCLPPDPQTPSGAIKPLLPPIAPQWKCGEGLQPHCCAGTLQEHSREAMGCVVCTILFPRYFLPLNPLSPPSASFQIQDEIRIVWLIVGSDGPFKWMFCNPWWFNALCCESLDLVMSHLMTGALIRTLTNTF